MLCVSWWSVEDAAVWLDTDGAIEWLQKYITTNKILPPILDDEDEEEVTSPEDDEEGEAADEDSDDVEAAAAAVEQEAKIDECIEKYRLAIERATQKKS